MSHVLTFSLIFLCCFTQCPQNVNAAKILAVFPLPSYSHYAVGSNLLKELAKRGHEITVISYYEEKNLPSNYSFKTIKLEIKKTGPPPPNFLTGDEPGPYSTVLLQNKMGSDLMVRPTLTHPEVQELLKSDQKFDAVIMDQFIDDGLAYLAKHFDAIHILLFTGMANSWVNPLVGNPAPPSVVPELLLEYSANMNFWQRLRNTVFYLFHELNRQLVFFPEQNRLVKEIIPNARPLYDYIYNVSLVLLNAHESVTEPVALVPNMKNVAGIHLKLSGKLPTDLQKYMDDAEEGVIFFSMGSSLKSKDLPVEVRDAMLRVFSKLKVKILWKWEDEFLPEHSSNIKLEKWLPQQQILAHPNTKIFISHGGLLSTIEAVFYGVPMLTLPVFADQHSNAATISERGYAINIPYRKFEEAKFEAALRELLTNNKYKKAVMTRSKIFLDRPLKPTEEAVFWVEYVIRHKGAEHLRVAALKLSWYQYLLLDVVAFLLAVVGIIFYSLRLALRRICCRTKCGNKLKTS